MGETVGKVRLQEFLEVIRKDIQTGRVAQSKRTFYTFGNARQSKMLKSIPLACADGATLNKLPLIAKLATIFKRHPEGTLAYETL